MTSLMRPVFYCLDPMIVRIRHLPEGVHCAFYPKPRLNDRVGWKNSTLINLCLMPCVGNKIARTAMPRGPDFQDAFRPARFQTSSWMVGKNEAAGAADAAREIILDV